MPLVTPVTQRDGNPSHRPGSLWRLRHQVLQRLGAEFQSAATKRPVQHSFALGPCHAVGSAMDPRSPAARRHADDHVTAFRYDQPHHVGGRHLAALPTADTRPGGCDRYDSAASSVGSPGASSSAAAASDASGSTVVSAIASVSASLSDASPEASASADSSSSSPS